MQILQFNFRKGSFVGALGLIFSTMTAHAGSVITTNLPTGTEIINIDGQNDGAHFYDGDQSNWYSPFATNGVLNEVTLGPGTYTFSVIDPTDAHAEFSGLTNSQLATMGAAWSYNTPFTTSYFVFDSSAANDPTQRQLFAGANTYNADYTAEAAYDEAKSIGSYDQIYTGPGGRNHGTVANSYTLTQTETLIFVAPDYYLPDNSGIESIVIQKAASPVPEPGPVLALSTGCVGLLLKRRKNARR